MKITWVEMDGKPESSRQGMLMYAIVRTDLHYHARFFADTEIAFVAVHMLLENPITPKPVQMAFHLSMQLEC